MEEQKVKKINDYFENLPEKEAQVFSNVYFQFLNSLFFLELYLDDFTKIYDEETKKGTPLKQIEKILLKNTLDAKTGQKIAIGLLNDEPEIKKLAMMWMEKPDYFLPLPTKEFGTFLTEIETDYQDYFLHFIENAAPLFTMQLKMTSPKVWKYTYIRSFLYGN